MEILLTVAGAALVLLTALDALTTTLVVGFGAGLVTRALLGAVWRIVLRVHRPDRESLALSTAGPALLITTVGLWVVGLWVGWTLIFLGGGPGVVVATATGRPAGVLDHFYFVGFTVVTLGVGDFTASSPGWRVLTAVASFSGLFLITLAITYLLSVVSAAVARRALALQIHALGNDAAAIVRNGWAGTRLSPTFVQQIVALSGPLTTTAEQHLAYPALHYFHSRQRSTSAPLAIAELHDALLMLRSGLRPDDRPDLSVTEPVRQAITRYLETTAVTFAPGERSDAMPLPPLEALREAGIPVVTDEELAEEAGQHGDRRDRLRQLVRSDGWTWPVPGPG